MLVKAGADVRATDANRNTCLILAACLGHTDIVRYLVSLPEVDLNHQGSNKCTALHFAVHGKHADVVQVLIDAGAVIETKNDEGRSALHVASYSEELPTVKMLVKAGADVRATDANRDTCLILAACLGHTDIVRYLVSLPEVDLNHQGKENDTALHFAVEGNMQTWCRCSLMQGQTLSVRTMTDILLKLRHSCVQLRWSCIFIPVN